MSDANATPIAIDGWRLFAHPLFLDQLESLIAEVERLRGKDPEGYRSRNASKRLAAVMRLMFNDIPQDPARKEYRQGSTLGPEHRHWHRAYGSKTDAHRVFQWVLAGDHPPDDWDELLQEARQAKRGCRRSRTDRCIRMAMSEAWTLSVLMVR